MSTTNPEPPEPSIGGHEAGAAAPQWLPLTLLVSLLAAYAALSHYSTIHPEARGLGAGLSVGPILLIGVALLWRWTSPSIGIASAIATGFVVWRYWPAIERDYEWADLAQQCGAYALVAAGFARSLAPGQTPLCEQLAVKMHGALAPIEVAYMRRATFVWLGFYVVLAGVILSLYFAAPLRIWSLFVNFGTFGLILLAGLADHAIRRRVLPHHTSGGILAVIRQSLIG